jgi:hypothetical protein
MNDAFRPPSLVPFVVVTDRMLRQIGLWPLRYIPKVSLSERHLGSESNLCNPTVIYLRDKTKCCLCAYLCIGASLF